MGRESVLAMRGSNAYIPCWVGVGGIPPNTRKGDMPAMPRYGSAYNVTPTTLRPSNSVCHHSTITFLLMYCSNHSSHLQTSQEPLIVLKQSHFSRPQMASWICSASSNLRHRLSLSLNVPELLTDLLGARFCLCQTSEVTSPFLTSPFTPPPSPLTVCFFRRTAFRGSAPDPKQSSPVHVRNPREPRSGRGAGGRDAVGHSMSGPFDRVRLHSAHSLLFNLPANAKTFCHPLETFSLRAVHFRMRRRTAAQSFGCALSELMMLCFATTTRSSFFRLLR